MPRTLIILLFLAFGLSFCSRAPEGEFDLLFPSELMRSGKDPLHVYAVEYPNEVSSYPFAGVEIPRDHYFLFSSDLARSWDELGWGVYAVGRYQNDYLIRIPGQYTSDQLALYDMENGQARFLLSLASRWCDEGWCNQQDAWLRDLNKDGLYDVITHYAQLDDQGAVVQQERTAYLQQADGLFVKSGDFDVRPEDYPLKTGE